MDKLPNASPPEKKPEREPANSMGGQKFQDDLNRVEQTLEILIRKRKQLGDYNADSPDIRALADALLIVTKGLRTLGLRQ